MGRGQATTEVVLLLPLFLFFLFAFAKIFAILVLVQKLEVASYYAARRWQLESHRNVAWEGWDQSNLCSDIEKKVSDYLGFGTPTQEFLGLVGAGAKICPVQRTQVWNIVTLSVLVRPIRMPLMKVEFTKPFEATKYVPNRDRPIAFVLPGLQN